MPYIINRHYFVKTGLYGNRALEKDNYRGLLGMAQSPDWSTPLSVEKYKVVGRCYSLYGANCLEISYLWCLELNVVGGVMIPKYEILVLRGMSTIVKQRRR